jgi:hypothetical protein
VVLLQCSRKSIIFSIGEGLHGYPPVKISA